MMKRRLNFKAAMVALAIAGVILGTAAGAVAGQGSQDLKMGILENMLTSMGAEARIIPVGGKEYFVAIGAAAALVTFNRDGSVAAIESAQDDDDGRDENSDLISCVIYEFTDFITDLVSCSISLNISCVISSVTQVIDDISWCIRWYTS